MAGILEPIGAVRHKGPRPDVSNPVCQCIDVAIGAIGEVDLLGEPILRNAFIRTHEKLVEACDQLRVILT